MRGFPQLSHDTLRAAVASLEQAACEWLEARGETRTRSAPACARVLELGGAPELASAATRIIESNGTAFDAEDGGFDMVDRLHREIARCLEPKRALRASSRWLATGIGLVAAAALVLGLWSMPVTPHVTASAFYARDPDYAPNLAVDGDPFSSWLLPSRDLGWLDVHFDEPRVIDTIRLLNTCNPPYDDRATSSYRVTLFRGEHALHSIDATWEFTVSPQPTRLRIDPPIEADRVRFEVLGWHGYGAGLAEIATE